MSGPRVTSELFVSALLRRVSGMGGMGAVVARGFAAAGAVHVEWRHRGEVGLLSPAITMDEDGERRFARMPASSEAEVAERMSRERSFDPEAWHVEIEGVDPSEVLTIVED